MSYSVHSPLAGVLGGKGGILMSVGTGTIAASNVDGFSTFAGGWGLHFVALGSGAWLDCAGLEHVLLCYDGLVEHREPARAQFAKFGDDPSVIYAFGIAAKPSDFGALALDIIAGVSAPTPLGLYIMIVGTGHVVGCLTKLSFQPGDTLCLFGGVGLHHAEYSPQDFLSGRINLRSGAMDGALQPAMSNLANIPEGSL